MSVQEARELLHLTMPVLVILIPAASFLIIKYSKSAGLKAFVFPMISVSSFFCLCMLLSSDLIEEQYNRKLITNYKSSVELFEVGTENAYSVRSYTSNDRHAVTKEFMVRTLSYTLAILSLYCSFRILKLTENVPAVQRKTKK